MAEYVNYNGISVINPAPTAGLPSRVIDDNLKYLVDNLVPYSGASDNLNLNAQSITNFAYLKDASNVSLLDSANRRLYSSTGQGMIGWSGSYDESALSFSGNSVILPYAIKDIYDANSIDTNLRQLFGASSKAMDWSTRNLFDELENQVLTWGDRKLHEADGTTLAVDWSGSPNTNASLSFDGNNHAIFQYGIDDSSSNNFLSIDPNVRKLYQVNGTSQAIDWSGDPTSSAAISFNGYKTQFCNIIQDTSNVDSLDTNNRQLKGAAANNIINYSATPNTDFALSFDDYNHAIFSQSIYDTNNFYASINTNSRVLYESNGTTQAIDWTGTQNGSSALSFKNQSAIFLNSIMDSSENPSLNTANRELYNYATGQVLINYSGNPASATAVLSFDSYGQVIYSQNIVDENNLYKSINTNDRQLANAYGNIQVDWSGAANSSYPLSFNATRPRFNSPIEDTLGVTAFDTTAVASQGVVICSNYGNPSSPVEGSIYFDTSDNHFYGYDGLTWLQLDN